MKFDAGYMKMALVLAERGAGYTSPNPMVGAVVVKDGQVVGKGWHAKAGDAHAEVMALDDAGDSARGATIYVTLEPCNHDGRTPPCTKKILDAGISTVVYAMTDPNPNVKGGGGDVLKQHKINVVAGVCEDEASKMNESFIKHTLTGRPFVILKCAATLDGRIATRTGHSKWITNASSRKFVHRLRHNVDGIMVGIGTVVADDPSLTARLDGVDGRDPVRVILDTKLSIDGNAKLLNLDSNAATLIVAGSKCPEKKRKAIEKKGAEVIIQKQADDRIDMDALMEVLGGRGITSLLIEGGSRVSASALGAGVVDKVCFFYAPKILGGDDGVPMLRGPGPDTIDQGIMLKDIHVRLFDDDIMVEGYIEH